MRCAHKDTSSLKWLFLFVKNAYRQLAIWRRLASPDVTRRCRADSNFELEYRQSKGGDLGVVPEENGVRRDQFGQTNFSG